jgi:hypothetical protein
MNWKRDWVLLSTSDFGSTHQLLLSVVSWNLPWLFTTHHGLKNIYFLTKFPMTPFQMQTLTWQVFLKLCKSLCGGWLADLVRYSATFCCYLDGASSLFDIQFLHLAWRTAIYWLLLNRFRSNERPHSSWCTLFSLQAFWHCHICSHCH